MKLKRFEEFIFKDKDLDQRDIQLKKSKRIPSKPEKRLPDIKKRIAEIPGWKKY
jgi:hypothetical protein